MPSIKAVLRSEKVKSDGSYQIYIRLFDKQSRKYFAIPYSVKEDDWDEEKGFVKRTHKNHSVINAIIRKKVAEVNADMLSAMANSADPDTVKVIRATAKKKTLNNFFTIADKYLAGLEKMNKFNRVSAERPRVNHLRTFHASEILRFEELTPGYIKKFQIFLKQEYDCGDRTICNHLIVLRTIYNYAIQEGVADRNLYPFGKGKILIKTPESKKVGLNEDEVHSIEKADLSHAPYLDFARNIWLFSFYLAGIRISDVLRMKWKDFADDRIIYQMGKNNKIVSLKLPEKVARILEKYRSAEVGEDDYVFGILERSDEDDPKLTYQKICSGNHKINKGLKKIAEDLKIKKKLSCHISRHTFGNITGDKISPQMLQKLYRHTDIKTTMGYQANFIHKDVDDALDSVLNF